MTKPKDKKKKRYPSLDGKGDSGRAFTKDEFVEALDKVIAKKISPDEGKSKKNVG